MSCHNINDPWPFIYWKRSESALQFHLKAINGPNPRYGKDEKEFKFSLKFELFLLFSIAWIWLIYSLQVELKGRVRMFPIYGRPGIIDLMT
jgi:hypothetical protein